MTKKQVGILRFSIVVGVLMLAFPPFLIEVPGMSIPAGYGFILDPPRNRLFIAPQIDYQRLVVQWLVLAVASLAFMAGAKE